MDAQRTEQMVLVDSQKNGPNEILQPKDPVILETSFTQTQKINQEEQKHL